MHALNKYNTRSYLRKFFLLISEELVEVKTTLGIFKGKIVENHLGTKVS